MQSTCVKCGGFYFEMVEAETTNSQHKLHFIQCATCGGVIGAINLYEMQTLIRQQQEDLSKLKRTLDTFVIAINQQAQVLQKIAKAVKAL